MPDADTVSYLYGVCRADAPAPPAVPSAPPLRLVRHGGLAAVVASVPADAFGTDGLEARLNDLEQLEVLARAHNAVVDAVHAGTTVLPMRLATVYLDDERVADVLRAGAENFGRLLDWLDGQEELGVKVYAIPTAAPVTAPVPEPGTAPDAPATAETGSESPGRAYLRRRQAQRRSHRDAYRTAGDVAARLPQAVAGLARARARHRPQQGELASRVGENIANEAYLVARSDLAGFRAAVASLATDVPGVRVEVTGPWAPYSFTTHPDTEGAATP
ncbi:GvpL/GvpF family gas vesicle protein [Streptomyces sp. NBC_01497]|uniref:GvpL/GvpF family gas vesicle protein n=1 Tax=Streptomyces sp. NBC_01497 TaxID=2903885 RepID=UPI002E347EA3|nr:GvpL/GvpF family gas vesicle protein [Streptomyces sp. NBC_01497]